MGPRTRPPQINPKSPPLDRTHFSWIDGDELPSNQMRAPLIDQDEPPQDQMHAVPINREEPRHGNFNVSPGVRFRRPPTGPFFRLFQSFGDEFRTDLCPRTSVARKRT